MRPLAEQAWRVRWNPSLHPPTPPPPPPSRALRLWLCLAFLPLLQANSRCSRPWHLVPHVGGECTQPGPLNPPEGRKEAGNLAPQPEPPCPPSPRSPKAQLSICAPGPAPSWAPSRPARPSARPGWPAPHSHRRGPGSPSPHEGRPLAPHPPAPRVSSLGASALADVISSSFKVIVWPPHQQPGRSTPCGGGLAHLFTAGSQLALSQCAERLRGRTAVPWPDAALSPPEHHPRAGLAVGAARVAGLRHPGCGPPSPACLLSEFTPSQLREPRTEEEGSEAQGCWEGGPGPGLPGLGEAAGTHPVPPSACRARRRT